ncbi:MAG: PepSY-like domain-containing protein [Bacteroidota bacterium]
MQTVNPFRAILLVLVLLTQLWALPAYALDPPDSVEKAFKEKFPNADGNKWTHTGDKPREYVVEFNEGNRKMKAFYDSKGTLIETEYEINPDQLPLLVKQALETQFQHFKILKSYVIERNDNPHAYELTIKSDGVKTVLIMSKDGYMIAR